MMLRQHSLLDIPSKHHTVLLDDHFLGAILLDVRRAFDDAFFPLGDPGGGADYLFFFEFLLPYWCCCVCVFVVGGGGSGIIGSSRWINRTVVGGIIIAISIFIFIIWYKNIIIIIILHIVPIATHTRTQRSIRQQFRRKILQFALSWRNAPAGRLLTERDAGTEQVGAAGHVGAGHVDHDLVAGGDVDREVLSEGGDGEADSWLGFSLWRVVVVVVIVVVV
mmetsp:Transcript_1407/g.2672  ORF Transcript_1407/g.2672 Transcript_1407/m.2672 type:complete len:221 (-) Transcript_1407:844-1506(-)